MTPRFSTSANPVCPGPLVWFDASHGDGTPAAILECATCGFIIVTGNFYDEAHAGCELLREGIVGR